MSRAFPSHWRVARSVAQIIVGGLLALASLQPVFGQTPETFETAYAELVKVLNKSQAEVDAALARVQKLEPTFTPQQREKFELVSINALGNHGRHSERVARARAFIGQVQSPVMRVRFLYELIHGHTALGEYQEALLAMNESIVLLPSLQTTSQKIVALQGAISLLTSLQAYEEALELVNRMYALRIGSGETFAACSGLVNLVELYMQWGRGDMARRYVPDALAACATDRNEPFQLIAKTYAAIDQINSGHYAEGIRAGTQVLVDLNRVKPNWDYGAQMQEALARAYLQTGNLERAQYYGQRAFDWAQTARILVLQEQTSETLATIKRAQGQLAAALALYDTNLALKKQVLDDRVQKNLAYQRVKFDTQDKANQLTLLEQRNQNLRMEKELHERQNENLILLLTLGLVLVVSLGGWLARVLSRMDRFRLSAQTDALTRVSNRAHFVAETTKALQQSARAVSLVVFDMDHFKHINDTYGHPTGDWVLQAVCETVKLQLDKGDVFGRLGGEEFALCVPDLAPDAVMTLAERCRIAILSIDTRPSGYSFAITSSFGVATRAAGETVPYEQMLVAADKALYVSKNNGRNRVTVYHPTAASAASIA